MDISRLDNVDIGFPLIPLPNKKATFLFDEEGNQLFDMVARFESFH